MFLRRLGSYSQKASTSCAGGANCPAILETESGDFAVIGMDITEEARGEVPEGSGCGPGERIVRIPRQVLIRARQDIPSEQ
jgi:hypothetical protein